MSRRTLGVVLCVGQLVGDDLVPELVLEQFRLLHSGVADQETNLRNGSSTSYPSYHNLHVSVQQPIQLKVVIVLAERIDQGFSNFQPTNKEGELEREEDWIPAKSNYIHQHIEKKPTIGPILRPGLPSLCCTGS